MKDVEKADIMLDAVHEVYGRALALCLQQDASCDQKSLLPQIERLRQAIRTCGFDDIPSAVHVSAEDVAAVKTCIFSFDWPQVIKIWLSVILDAGRIRHILGAVLVCRRIVMRGRETLYVESAHALSPQEKEQLEIFGKKRLGECAGVAHTINPELLAGVRLRKGWQEVDLSLQSNIIQIKEDLYRC